MATDGNSRSDSGRQISKTEVLACLPSLRAFAISLSGNVDRADDLVQQTMLNALANLNLFTPGTNLSAWLFSILRNHFRSDWRKRKREVEWDPQFEDALFFSTGSENGGEAASDLNRILMYMACLPVKQSDALIAIGYLGMSYEEAAERLQCAVGTIKSRVNRARTELLRHLRESALEEVDLSAQKTATRGVPRTHPYYPIAQAYELLYANYDDVGGSSGTGEERAPTAKDEQERLWEQLVASGALDE